MLRTKRDPAPYAWGLAIFDGAANRLANAFSKKVENHAAMVALYFMWYNFGRVRQTLRVTSATEPGIADHVFRFEEIVDLMGTK